MAKIIYRLEPIALAHIIVHKTPTKLITVTVTVPVLA
jgi:hypothetical protein